MDEVRMPSDVSALRRLWFVLLFAQPFLARRVHLPWRRLLGRVSDPVVAAISGAR
jgi:hypothetical protein